MTAFGVMGVTTPAERLTKGGVGCSIYSRRRSVQGHHHIDPQATASGTDQPLAPIEHGSGRCAKSAESSRPGCATYLYRSGARRSPRTGSSRRSAGPPPVSAWATFIRTYCAMRAASSWSTMGSIRAPSRPISAIGKSPIQPVTPKWTLDVSTASSRINPQSPGTQ
jgi:hypothetical protein